MNYVIITSVIVIITFITLYIIIKKMIKEEEIELPIRKDYKKVIQYDINWNYLKEWNSRAEASRDLDILSTNIGACCRWVRKSAWWYKWKNK